MPNVLRDALLRWLERQTAASRRLGLWLAGRVPALRRWLGDRPELPVSAVGGSVLTHLVLLLLLAMIVSGAGALDRVPAFRSELPDPSLADFATLDTQALAEIHNTDMNPVAGSFAPLTSAILADRYDAGGRAAVPPPNGPAEVKVAPELRAESIQVAGVALPKPTQLDTTVSIRGSGAEHVETVEGAVDRVAVEILRRLEQGRTLVVWMFDASGSLLAERQRLATYIDGVYAHIDDYDEGRLSSDEALLTAVVAFGRDRKLMTDQPTTDRAAIVRAIRDVPLDKSGFESTFRTVGEVARRFGRYKKDGRSYRAMVVVVTDEIGDDPELLEPAILAANSVKMPVYVLGSGALFGRVEGYMDYTDPETKQTFHRLPVNQGPESVLPEGIRLPFWYDGDQYELLDSGFGPHALSRLAGATGGIYFITRMGGHRVTFDPDALREYQPDWIDQAQYQAMLAREPLRRAVMRAGVIMQQDLPRIGYEHLNFPAVEAPDFKERMTRNQAIVARIEYAVNEALGVERAAPGEPTIAAVARLRDREPSRRWRAHYDLIRGRLMAMKVRCREYNEACARIKRDMPKFTNPRSNTWRLRPSRTIHLGERAEEAAKEATALLERVIREHPGTPWALLAQRELQDPLGLDWVEAHVAPPPPRRDADNNANNRRNRPPPPKPVEVPKL
jgi:hypothetical protein